MRPDRSPAKTEAQRCSSTLRAAGAPHRGSCATAASGCRDSDLDIWGATHHRVPWMNSVPSCFILSLVVLNSWLRSFSGRVTAVLPAVNSLHQLLEASQVLLIGQLNLGTLDSRDLAQLRQIQMTSLRLAAKNPACTRGLTQQVQRYLCCLYMKVFPET